MRDDHPSSPDTPRPQSTNADYTPVRDALRQYLAGPQPEPRRLFHGRGQCFAGLEHITIDWYPPVLLLTFYREPEDPLVLLAAIRAADANGQVHSVVLQQRRKQQVDSMVLWGDQVDSCIVTENGLRYEVRPGANRNAGLFLDMRPLRQWLQENCGGRNVLNLFAYTCSLSVAALAGGARQVTSVDMSRSSMQWGLRNHLLNGQDPGQIRSVPHNLFTSWGRIRQLGRYDTLLVDPPTRQRGSFDVEKNYPTVIRRLPGLVNPGADIVATINSPFLGPEYLVEQFKKHAPELTFLGLMPVAPEFRDRYPERGLNICHFRLA